MSGELLPQVARERRRARRDTALFVLFEEK